MHKAISLLFTATSLLVIALAVLLCLQWPLREAFQAYSRQANDLAQMVFAGYVAVGVAAASMRRVHLTAKTSRVPTAWGVRLRAWALVLCTAPWALWMLWSCLPAAVQSVQGAERFPDTLNPGYFVLRLALVLMMALVLVVSVLPSQGALPQDPTQEA